MTRNLCYDIKLHTFICFVHFFSLSNIVKSLCVSGCWGGAGMLYSSHSFFSLALVLVFLSPCAAFSRSCLTTLPPCKRNGSAGFLVCFSAVLHRQKERVQTLLRPLSSSSFKLSHYVSGNIRLLIEPQSPYRRRFLSRKNILHDVGQYVAQLLLVRGQRPIGCPCVEIHITSVVFTLNRLPVDVDIKAVAFGRSLYIDIHKRSAISPKNTASSNL